MIVGLSVEYMFEFDPSKEPFLPEEFYDENANLIVDHDFIRDWINTEEGKRYLAESFVDDVREWIYHLNSPAEWNFWTYPPKAPNLELGL